MNPGCSSHGIPSRHVARHSVVALAVATCFSSGSYALPTDPAVVNGSATFNQSGKVLNVTNSNGAIINWNTFSIGAGETTRFIQTSASSSVLNRVLSNDPSLIYGTLSSNGRVWLVNPAGIMVGAGGRVDVAGFVASTLNIRNEDFLAGKNLFQNTPGAGSVINQGSITTPSGGSVYLIAPNVTNEGIIHSPNGEVILAAGQTVSLIDSATPGVKVDITGAQGNVTNLGSVVAEAGRIGMAGVLVKNSGTINASSVVSEGGRIFLRARQSAVLDPTSEIRADGGGKGAGGNVIVWSDQDTRADGIISTRGGSDGGRGGFVETSGKGHLSVGDIRVDTGGGQWLLDPNDFTIGVDISGATLSSNLESNDVFILSSDGAMPGGGDIFVNESVSWSSNKSLVLSAYRDVVVNQPISGPNSDLIYLYADNLGTGTGTVSFSGAGSVTIGGAGVLYLFYNPTSYSSPTDYSSWITGPHAALMLVNSLGNEGDEVSGTHGLQAMATNLAGNYALGRDIDASATAGWNSGDGFVPIGNAVTPFTGKLYGVAQTITSLTINRPTTDHVGLFGQIDASGEVSNVVFDGANITGREHVGTLAGINQGLVTFITGSVGSVTGNGYDVGGLVGFHDGGIISSSSFSGTVANSGSGTRTGGLVGANWGTINDSSSAASVSGWREVGGLAGGSSGSIVGSSATGPVSGTGDDVGGLVGHVWGNAISDSHATGPVSSAGIYTGGLVGYNAGNVTLSYATGNVTNTNPSWSYAGGLVGRNDGTVSLSFAAGNVSGGNGVGGLAGLNTVTSGTIVQSYASGAVSGGLDVGGLVGENRGPVTDSYATGAVTSDDDRIGGLTGWNSGAIMSSFAVGAVSCSGVCSSVGGLVGENNAGTVINSFWDMDTTGQSTSAGGGTGLNTAGMKTAATFLAAGWSTMTWDLADGSYPGLTGMPGAPGCAGYDNCWTGASDSLWATAGNWSAGHAPTGAESVKIDVAGTPTITLAGINPSFGSLWLAENLDVDAGVTFTLSNLFTLTAGTATFDGTATMHGYAQTGGILAGSGNFTVTDNYLQSGGGVNGNVHMTITQTSGPLNYSATLVGSATLNAEAIVLGPINTGSLSITTDSLQVTAPVLAGGVMALYPKTYSAIRLGSTAANTLSLLQSDLDNLTVGEAQFFAPILTVDNGANTVTLANFDTVQLGSQVSIDSPLALTLPGSTLFLNANRIDINETITAGAGGVFLGQNASSVAYLIGVGSKTYPANTVELSNAELNRILTTGPVIIGDPYNAHNVAHGSMQIVGPIDLTGITSQLRLVGNGVTQAAGATITVPQLAVDGYGSINLPEANVVGTFAAKSVNGNVTFASAGSLTIGKVETTASPTNFATAGVVASNAGAADITAAGPLTIAAGAGQAVSVTAGEVWLNFNGDLSLNAGAGGQAYVEAALVTTIHLDFSNSAGKVRFNGTIATDPTNGLPGPGTPDFIGFWDSAAAAIPGSNLLLTNTSFSFTGALCAGFDNCWTGAVDSLWATAGNWSAGHAPTGSENVKVDVAGTPTIALTGVNPSFGSLWLAENLNVDAGVSFSLSNLFTLSAGTATFDGTATTQGYVQTGGVLAGSGTFTVASHFAQTGGSINRSGNINIVHSGNLQLGDITTTGSFSATASGRIFGGVHRVRGDAITLVSQNGGVAGGRAIDLDVEAGSALTATVNAGAAQGGIHLRNFGASAPATIALTDTAGSQQSVAFYQDSDLVLGAGHSFNAGSGGIVVGAGGSLSGIETVRFGGTPAQLTLIADDNLSLSNVLSLPSTHIGLSAAGSLDIGHNLGALHLAANGGTINIGAMVTAAGDIALGAGVLNVHGNVAAQYVSVGTGTLNVGGSGGIHASQHLLAVVGGNAQVVGGYLKSGGDFELLVGGNLSISDQGHLWAGYGQMSPPFADASIAVGGDLSLSNGAHVIAANDVYLDLLGADSVLSLAGGPAGPSFVLSDFASGLAQTTHISFFSRNSGGILIDGVETAVTRVGGSGFFAIDTNTPALPGAGLAISYAQQAGDSITAQLVNAINQAVDDVDPTTTPTDDNGPKPLGARDEKGNQEDGFGDDDEDKDKKKSDAGKGEKKDEKPAQKKVAQCM
jgi:filamentous hemagglutinin family protein